MQRNNGIDPRVFANSVRALLDEDPRRYRNFGMFWFFVKALLKRFFDRNDIPILGDYEDTSVNERIPDSVRWSPALMMQAAAEEYAHNASFNLGRAEVMDDDGQFFTVMDADIDA